MAQRRDTITRPYVNAAPPGETTRNAGAAAAPGRQPIGMGHGQPIGKGHSQPIGKGHSQPNVQGNGKPTSQGSRIIAESGAHAYEYASPFQYRNGGVPPRRSDSDARAFGSGGASPRRSDSDARAYEDGGFPPRRSDSDARAYGNGGVPPRSAEFGAHAYEYGGPPSHRAVTGAYAYEYGGARRHAAIDIGVGVGAGARSRDGGGEGDGGGDGDGFEGGARYLRIMAALVVLATVTLFLFMLAADSGDGEGGGLFGGIRGIVSGSAGSGRAQLAGAADQPILSLPYDSDEGAVFCLYRGYIAECSKAGLYLFDKSGAEVLKISMDYGAPGLTQAGNYLLVYDVGGRSAFVLEDLAVRWEERFTSNIISATVNKDGYLAFVLETPAYRNSIRVMAPVGRKLFDWIVADDYVVSAEVSPDSGSMLVNRLKADGISVRSGLEFLDMRSEPFAALDSGEDNVFLSAKFLEDSSVATVTGTDFAMYSSGLKPLGQDSFDAVMAMCEFPARRASVAAQRDGRLSIRTYNQRGASQELYAPELPVVNMASGDGLLLVNMGRRVAVLRENGKAALALALDSDALYGSLSGKQYVLVVTKKSADLYGLR